MGECHSGGLESVVVEGGQGGVNPRPGYEEDGAHRHSDAAAVEWIAGVAGEQGAVDA